MAKKEKKETRPNSLRRLLQTMIEKLEATRVSLQEAMDQAGAGNFASAIAAVGEAMRASDTIEEAWFGDLVVGLERANEEVEAVIERVNR